MGYDVMGAAGATFGNKVVELANQTKAGGVTRQEFESKLDAILNRVADLVMSDVATDQDLSAMFRVISHNENPAIRALGKALESPRQPNIGQLYSDLRE